MAERCGINEDHEFESRAGALKIWRDGGFTRNWACPSCVEAVREDEITDYRIFVIEGREVLIPTAQIDV